MAAKKSKQPMEHYNMSDLLRGQASKINHCHIGKRYSRFCAEER